MMVLAATCAALAVGADAKADVAAIQAVDQGWLMCARPRRDARE